MNFDIKNFELKTKRLFLRPLEQSDVQSVFQVTQEYPAITKFVTWSTPKAIKETQAFFDGTVAEFNAQKSVRWGIFYKDEFVGVISIDDIHQSIGRWKADLGEIGYWLSPAYHKKGFIPEAVAVVLQFVFKKMKCHKVIGNHISDNTPSGKVMEKSGFRHVGTARKHLFDNGKWYDLERYEILAEDFLARK